MNDLLSSLSSIPKQITERLSFVDALAKLQELQRACGINRPFDQRQAVVLFWDIMLSVADFFAKIPQLAAEYREREELTSEQEEWLEKLKALAEDIDVPLEAMEKMRSISYGIETLIETALLVTRGELSLECIVPALKVIADAVVAFQDLFTLFRRDVAEPAPSVDSPPVAAETNFDSRRDDLSFETSASFPPSGHRLRRGVSNHTNIDFRPLISSLLRDRRRRQQPTASDCFDSFSMLWKEVQDVIAPFEAAWGRAQSVYNSALQVIDAVQTVRNLLGPKLGKKFPATVCESSPGNQPGSLAFSVKSGADIFAPLAGVLTAVQESDGGAYAIIRRSASPLINKFVRVGPFIAEKTLKSKVGATLSTSTLLGAMDPGATACTGTDSVTLMLSVFDNEELTIATDKDLLPLVRQPVLANLPQIASVDARLDPNIVHLEIAGDVLVHQEILNSTFILELGIPLNERPDRRRAENMCPGASDFDPSEFNYNKRTLLYEKHTTLFYKSYLFQVGPLPLSLTFDLGGLLSVTSDVTVRPFERTVIGALIPRAGAVFNVQIGIQLGPFRAGIGAQGALMDTSIEARAQLFINWPLDICLRGTLTILPLRIQVYAYFGVRVKVVFFTLSWSKRVNIASWSAPTFVRTLVDTCPGLTAAGSNRRRLEPSVPVDRGAVDTIRAKNPPNVLAINFVATAGETSPNLQFSIDIASDSPVFDGRVAVASDLKRALSAGDSKFQDVGPQFGGRLTTDDTGKPFDHTLSYFMIFEAKNKEGLKIRAISKRILFPPPANLKLKHKIVLAPDSPSRDVFPSNIKWTPVCGDAPLAYYAQVEVSNGDFQSFDALVSIMTTGELQVDTTDRNFADAPNLPLIQQPANLTAGSNSTNSSGTVAVDVVEGSRVVWIQDSAKAQDPSPRSLDAAGRTFVVGFPDLPEEHHRLCKRFGGEYESSNAEGAVCKRTFETVSAVFDAPRVAWGQAERRCYEAHTGKTLCRRTGGMLAELSSLSDYDLDVSQTAGNRQLLIDVLGLGSGGNHRQILTASAGLFLKLADGLKKRQRDILSPGDPDPTRSALLQYFLLKNAMTTDWSWPQAQSYSAYLTDGSTPPFDEDALRRESWADLPTTATANATASLAALDRAVQIATAIRMMGVTLDQSKIPSYLNGTLPVPSSVPSAITSALNQRFSAVVAPAESLVACVTSADASCVLLQLNQLGNGTEPELLLLRRSQEFAFDSVARFAKDPRGDVLNHNETRVATFFAEVLDGLTPPEIASTRAAVSAPPSDVAVEAKLKQFVGEEPPPSQVSLNNRWSAPRNDVRSGARKRTSCCAVERQTAFYSLGALGKSSNETLRVQTEARPEPGVQYVHYMGGTFKLINISRFSKAPLGVDNSSAALGAMLVDYVAARTFPTEQRRFGSFFYPEYPTTCTPSTYLDCAYTQCDFVADREVLLLDRADGVSLAFLGIYDLESFTPKVKSCLYEASSMDTWTLIECTVFEKEEKDTRTSVLLTRSRKPLLPGVGYMASSHVYNGAGFSREYLSRPIIADVTAPTTGAVHIMQEEEPGVWSPITWINTTEHVSFGLRVGCYPRVPLGLPELYLRAWPLFGLPFRGDWIDDETDILLSSRSVQLLLVGEQGGFTVVANSTLEALQSSAECLADMSLSHLVTQHAHGCPAGTSVCAPEQAMYGIYSLLSTARSGRTADAGFNVSVSQNLSYVADGRSAQLAQDTYMCCEPEFRPSFWISGNFSTAVRAARSCSTPPGGYNETIKLVDAHLCSEDDLRDIQTQYSLTLLPLFWIQRHLDVHYLTTDEYVAVSPPSSFQQFPGYCCSSFAPRQSPITVFHLNHTMEPKRPGKKESVVDPAAQSAPMKSIFEDNKYRVRVSYTNQVLLEASNMSSPFSVDATKPRSFSRVSVSVDGGDRSRADAVVVNGERFDAVDRFHSVASLEGFAVKWEVVDWDSGLDRVQIGLSATGSNRTLSFEPHVPRNASRVLTQLPGVSQNFGDKFVELTVAARDTARNELVKTSVLRVDRSPPHIAPVDPIPAVTYCKGSRSVTSGSPGELVTVQIDFEDCGFNLLNNTELCVGVVGTIEYQGLLGNESLSYEILYPAQNNGRPGLKFTARSYRDAAGYPTVASASVAYLCSQPEKFPFSYQIRTEDRKSVPAAATACLPGTFSSLQMANATHVRWKDITEWPSSAVVTCCDVEPAAKSANVSLSHCFSSPTDGSLFAQLISVVNPGLGPRRVVYPFARESLMVSEAGAADGRYEAATASPVQVMSFLLTNDTTRDRVRRLGYYEVNGEHLLLALRVRRGNRILWMPLRHDDDVPVIFNYPLGELALRWVAASDPQSSLLPTATAAAYDFEVMQGEFSQEYLSRVSPQMFSVENAKVLQKALPRKTYVPGGWFHILTSSGLSMDFGLGAQGEVHHLLQLQGSEANTTVNVTLDQATYKRNCQTGGAPCFSVQSQDGLQARFDETGEDYDQDTVELTSETLLTFENSKGKLYRFKNMYAKVNGVANLTFEALQETMACQCTSACINGTCEVRSPFCLDANGQLPTHGGKIGACRSCECDGECATLGGSRGMPRCVVDATSRAGCVGSDGSFVHEDGIAEAWAVCRPVCRCASHSACSADGRCETLDTHCVQRGTTEVPQNINGTLWTKCESCNCGTTCTISDGAAEATCLAKNDHCVDVAGNLGRVNASIPCNPCVCASACTGGLCNVTNSNCVGSDGMQPVDLVAQCNAEPCVCVEGDTRLNPTIAPAEARLGTCARHRFKLASQSSPYAVCRVQDPRCLGTVHSEQPRQLVAANGVTGFFASCSPEPCSCQPDVRSSHACTQVGANTFSCVASSAACIDVDQSSPLRISDELSVRSCRRCRCIDECEPNGLCNVAPDDTTCVDYTGARPVNALAQCRSCNATAGQLTDGDCDWIPGLWWPTGTGQPTAFNQSTSAPPLNCIEAHTCSAAANCSQFSTRDCIQRLPGDLYKTKLLQPSQQVCYGSNGVLAQYRREFDAYVAACSPVPVLSLNSSTANCTNTIDRWVGGPNCDPWNPCLSRANCPLCQCSSSCGVNNTCEVLDPVCLAEDGRPPFYDELADMHIIPCTRCSCIGLECKMDAEISATVCQAEAGCFDEKLGEFSGDGRALCSPSSEPSPVCRCQTSCSRSVGPDISQAWCVVSDGSCAGAMWYHGDFIARCAQCECSDACSGGSQCQVNAVPCYSGSTLIEDVNDQLSCVSCSSLRIPTERCSRMHSDGDDLTPYFVLNSSDPRVYDCIDDSGSLALLVSKNVSLSKCLPSCQCANSSFCGFHGGASYPWCPVETRDCIDETDRVPLRISGEKYFRAKCRSLAIPARKQIDGSAFNQLSFGSMEVAAVTRTPVSLSFRLSEKKEGSSSGAASELSGAYADMEGCYWGLDGVLIAEEARPLTCFSILSPDGTAIEFPVGTVPVAVSVFRRTFVSQIFFTASNLDAFDVVLDDGLVKSFHYGIRGEYTIDAWISAWIGIRPRSVLDRSAGNATISHITLATDVCGSQQASSSMCHFAECAVPELCGGQGLNARVRISVENAALLQTDVLTPTLLFPASNEIYQPAEVPRDPLLQSLNVGAEVDAWRALTEGDTRVMLRPAHWTDSESSLEFRYLDHLGSIGITAGALPERDTQEWIQGLGTLEDGYQYAGDNKFRTVPNARQPLIRVTAQEVLVVYEGEFKETFDSQLDYDWFDESFAQGGFTGSFPETFLRPGEVSRVMRVEVWNSLLTNDIGDFPLRRVQSLSPPPGTIPTSWPPKEKGSRAVRVCQALIPGVGDSVPFARLAPMIWNEWAARWERYPPAAVLGFWETAKGQKELCHVTTLRQTNYFRVIDVAKADVDSLAPPIPARGDLNMDRVDPNVCASAYEPPAPYRRCSADADCIMPFPRCNEKCRCVHGKRRFEWVLPTVLVLAAIFCIIMVALLVMRRRKQAGTEKTNTDDCKEEIDVVVEVSEVDVIEVAEVDGIEYESEY